MSLDEDALATATLLRQHFAKLDSTQIANELIVKETLGAPLMDTATTHYVQSLSPSCHRRPPCLVPCASAGQGTYGRVRLAEFTDPTKALMAEQGIATTGVFALKVV